MDVGQVRTCFVIAPIGEAGREIRQRSDKVLKHIVRPVAASEGYQVVQADEISDPGSITSQVIQHLLADDSVVADLSGHNPNVFYELAVRHASRKPVVSLIAANERIPFDVADQRAIRYELTDPDEIEKSREALRQQIQSATSSSAQIETPITQAGNLELLRRSSNPLEQALADVLSGQGSLAEAQRSFGDLLAEVKGAVFELRKRIE